MMKKKNLFFLQWLPILLVIYFAWVGFLYFYQEALIFFPIKAEIAKPQNKFNSLEKIQNIKSPILIMHSPDDEVINFQQEQQLFENAPEPKRFITLFGSHNQGWQQSFSIY